MGRVKNTEPKRDTVKKKKTEKSEEEKELYRKYQRYLKSDKFKEIREIVFERDGNRCCACGRGVGDGAVLNCHHRSYDHLFHEEENDYQDLRTLCQTCHRAIHRVPSNWSRFRINHRTEDDLKKNNPR